MTIKHRLVRQWRSLSLPTLKQGSTLSIRSQGLIPTHVLLQSEWRDDGMASFENIFAKDSISASGTVSSGGSTNNNNHNLNNSHASHPPWLLRMHVQEREEMQTSLGRMAPHVSIDLVSALDTTLATEEGDDSDSTIRSTEFDGTEHLAERGAQLTMQVPEKLNVHCDLTYGGNISVQGKLEGDIHLSTTQGDIRVTKLRGHNIDLKVSSSVTTDDRQSTSSSSSLPPAPSIIYASDLLEAANLNIETTGRVRVKQIHGTTINIVANGMEDAPHQQMIDIVEEDADDEGSIVDISALFVGGDGGATIQVEDHVISRRAVRVKSNHGPLLVKTRNLTGPSETNIFTGERYPAIELGGINGQCEVQSIQNVTPDNQNGKSCVIHIDSLSPESVSLVVVDGGGDIALTVDRKVEVDVRLLSLAGTRADSLIESGELLADEEDDEMVVKVLQELPGESHSTTATGTLDDERIHVSTKAFTRKPLCFQADSVSYVEGYVLNKSAEPDSRFERRTRHDRGSIGKISLDGAADQALKRFTAPNENENNNASDDPSRPLFAVVGTGEVSLETVSWLGAIARRYGLNEKGTVVGRTASRRGRQLESQDTEG